MPKPFAKTAISHKISRPGERQSQSSQTVHIFKDCIDPEKQKPFNTVLKTISYALYYTQPFRQNFPLTKLSIHLLHNPDLFQLILLLFPLAALSLSFPVHWPFFAFLFSWGLFVVQLPCLILCRKWVNKTMMTVIHDITAIYHVMIYLCVSLLSSLTLTSSSTVTQCFLQKHHSSWKLPTVHDQSRHWNIWRLWDCDKRWW